MAPLNTPSSLTLSYDATEILGEQEKSLFLHKRPLLNADTMVKKGHFKSALEIYYRTASKITNQNIVAKIQKNISDIHNYLKSSDSESEKAISEKYSDNRGKEFTESLKELTENLSDSLTEKLNILKQIETLPRKKSENPLFADRAIEEPPIEEDENGIKTLDLGSLEAKPKPKEQKPKDEVEEIQATVEYTNDADNEGLPQDKKPKQAKIKIPKDDLIGSSDKTEVSSQTTEIKNEKAEIKNETNIQNANLQAESLQIDSTKQLQSEVTENTSSKIEPDSYENKPPSKDVIPSSTKKNPDIVEEVKIIKEYIQKIESTVARSDSDEIDQTRIETGWSELEKEPPKNKSDKDYAPQMKKYEVGSIEIPEATEFFTGDFISREASEIQRKEKTDKDSTKEEPFFSPDIANDTNKQARISDSGQTAFNIPAMPPPLPPNINDWLSNLYFSKEWEMFKPLPLKERRSGKERRQNKSNQLPEGIKKDRRSGTDRRKQNENLLHARDAFLKDWHQSQYPPSFPNPYSAGSFPANLGPESSAFVGEASSEKDAHFDPNLRTLEFLPRDPGSHEKLQTPEDLVKVDLPDPEEIILKPPIDQDEYPREEVKSDIADTLKKYIPANEELGLPESDKGLVKIDLPNPVSLKADTNDLPQREVSGEIEVSSKDGTGIVSEAVGKDRSGMGPVPYTPEAYEIPEELKIDLPDPDDFIRTKTGHLIDPFAPEETPDINIIDGDGPKETDESSPEISEIPELPPPPPEPERTIHGILELKPPEIDDAPFLTLTYDFSKIPHPFKLSKNYSIMEYSYYKYKPMLMKAQEFARRKMLKNALNYYRVIKSQNIPPELKNMINRNIT
ncbi:MAG TPA: hypothetical protein PK930_26290, partial [Leptospiraceae bacterium]|nr:hypothetical protein [Leptospiraceae bacterium]